jgi:hypothetical protein
MSEQKRIEHGIENVFQFINPQTCNCSLHHYHIGHSELILDIRSKESPAYLWFIGTAFVQCPTRWVDASFRTASRDQCIDTLLQRFGKHKFVPSMADTYRLYIVDTSSVQIKILAASGYRHDSFREYLQNKDENLLKLITFSPATGEPMIQKHYDRETDTFVHNPNVNQSPSPRAGITVKHLLDLLEQGYTLTDILARHSWLEPEDIQAALIYARRAISKPSDT